MQSNQVLESLLGERVSVFCLDREETEINGELLEVSTLGATVKTSSHAREFIEFIPIRNVNFISHKILDK